MFVKSLVYFYIKLPVKALCSTCDIKKKRYLKFEGLTEELLVKEEITIIATVCES